MEAKECTHCHKVKPIKEGFYLIRKEGKQVRASWCKECSKSYTREWNAIERERARASKRKQLESLQPYLTVARELRHHFDSPKAKWAKGWTLKQVVQLAREEGRSEFDVLAKCASLAARDIWKADGTVYARYDSESWSHEG